MNWKKLKTSISGFQASKWSMIQSSQEYFINIPLNFDILKAFFCASIDLFLGFLGIGTGIQLFNQLSII